MVLPTHKLEDAHQLRIARAIMDYSQMEFARMTGVTKSYVSKMERGTRPLNDKAKGFIRVAFTWLAESEAFQT